MPGPWTDAHCHLADARIESDLDSILERSRSAGVVSWIQGGVDPADWTRQKQLRARIGDSVRPVFGLHPWWVAGADDQRIDHALATLQDELGETRALGEIGLDMHPRRAKPDGALDRQRRAFVAQLDLIADHPRPMVLHVVRAHGDVLAELERRGPFPRGGLVHAFAGTLDDARRYVQLGLTLSLGGRVCSNLDRVRPLGSISPDHIVIETDSPDGAPRDWGVDRNEPALLPRIADTLAPIWGLCGAELLDRAHISLETVFGP